MRNTYPHWLPETEPAADIIPALTPWQRIEAIIDYYDLPSVSAFARDLGIARAEKLFQIKKGNNGISMKLAGDIAQAYPRLSKTWLLTGEGLMFPDLADPGSILHHVAAIPYYTGFPHRKPPDKPDKNVYFSKEFVDDGGFAAIYRHDAMHPLLKTGSIVILSKLQVISELVYGEVHFVETDAFGVFRIVRRGTEYDRLLLQALQRDKYDDLEIDKACVKAIFKVRAAMTVL